MSEIADASLVIVLAWVFSPTGSLMLRRSGISGLLYGLPAVTVLAGSLTLAYIVIRTMLRPGPR